VDWGLWKDDEKLAALSRVLLPRGDAVVMNAADLADFSGPKPTTLQLPSKAPAAPKRLRSLKSDVEFFATYQGISAKRAGAFLVDYI
jgi:hypothetical protein